VQWKCDSWSLAAKDLCGPWHPPSYPPNSSGCCDACNGSAIAGVWLPRTCGPWHPPSHPPNSSGCCGACSGSAIAGVWLPRTSVVLGTHPLTHQIHLPRTCGPWHSPSCPPNPSICCYVFAIWKCDSWSLKLHVIFCNIQSLQCDSSPDGQVQK
jgi:hypothetical protein